MSNLSMNKMNWQYFFTLCRMWADENPRKAYVIRATRDAFRILALFGGSLIILHGAASILSGEPDKTLSIPLFIVVSVTQIILLREMWFTGKTFGKSSEDMRKEGAKRYLNSVYGKKTLR